MKQVKVTLDLSAFPEKLRPLLGNHAVYDSSSCSKAKVYFIDSGVYLKIAEKNALQREARLGRWFYQKGLGPQVIDYLCLERDYLLTKAADGSDGLTYLDDPERLCKIIAMALRKLHSLRFDDFPEFSRMERTFAAAQDGQTLGRFDPSCFLARWKINDQETARQLIRKNKSRLKADTLIHGDPCLPNLIFKDGQFQCFIDFDSAGIGDRHIDLFWVIWSFQRNLGTDRYTEPFLQAYGKEDVDEELLKTIAALEAFG